MPDLGYVIAALVIAGAITVALRAVPFAVLKPLRESRLVLALGLWMPVGILAILAASTWVGTFTGDAGIQWATAAHAALAAAVTVAVHLLCGRRTLLSIGLGTLTFVLLVNLL
ncbi:AzlD domain-containing protein [Citricoccus sp. K5]|uniref:AzlD domain-containing protein n=1 Tax=Citricoccus sp. K5 TaxID=2653135 RepID=UPI0012EF30F0|nr:AzlD domain-containing protein [Citricoccus sp. K5]VXB99840.1 Branched-subunit amino acid transport protein AzlD [Citricoccus sp. K5]